MTQTVTLGSSPSRNFSSKSWATMQSCSGPWWSSTPPYLAKKWTTLNRHSKYSKMRASAKKRQWNWSLNVHACYRKIWSCKSGTSNSHSTSITRSLRMKWMTSSRPSPICTAVICSRWISSWDSSASTGLPRSRSSSLWRRATDYLHAKCPTSWAYSTISSKFTRSARKKSSTSSMNTQNWRFNTGRTWCWRNSNSSQIIDKDCQTPTSETCSEDIQTSSCIRTQVWLLKSTTWRGASIGNYKEKRHSRCSSISTTEKSYGREESWWKQKAIETTISSMCSASQTKTSARSSTSLWISFKQRRTHADHWKRETSSGCMLMEFDLNMANYLIIKLKDILLTNSLIFKDN